MFYLHCYDWEDLAPALALAPAAALLLLLLPLLLLLLSLLLLLLLLLCHPKFKTGFKWRGCIEWDSTERVLDNC